MTAVEQKMPEIAEQKAYEKREAPIVEQKAQAPVGVVPAGEQKAQEKTLAAQEKSLGANLSVLGNAIKSKLSGTPEKKVEEKQADGTVVEKKEPTVGEAAGDVAAVAQAKLKTVSGAGGLKNKLKGLFK